MAKDPAFLFYPNDWIGGTMTLTRHQKGCYIDLLVAQFNSGPLSIDHIKTILGTDQASWTVLSSKFKETGDGRWFNERLETEKAKRSRYINSRKENAKKGGRPKKNEDPPPDKNHMQTICKPYAKAYKNHTENININEDEDNSSSLVLSSSYPEENHIALIPIENLREELKQPSEARNARMRMNRLTEYEHDELVDFFLDREIGKERTQVDRQETIYHFGNWLPVEVKKISSQKGGKEESFMEKLSKI